MLLSPTVVIATWGSFANEYPSFGRYEVYHHSEFLARLIDEAALLSASGAR